MANGYARRESSVLSTTRFSEAVWPMSLWFIGRFVSFSESFSELCAETAPNCPLRSSTPFKTCALRDLAFGY